MEKIVERIVEKSSEMLKEFYLTEEPVCLSNPSSSPFQNEVFNGVQYLI